jgi:hypothetical protein
VIGDWDRIVVRAAARGVPSQAELAQTVLASCPFPEIITRGLREPVEMHGIDPAGRPILVASESSPAADLVGRSPEGVPIVLQAAQLRPVRVPDRVRAHVTFHGWLDAVPSAEHSAVMLQLGHTDRFARCAAPPDGCTLLRAEPGAIELDGAAVELDEFRRAAPDPFAQDEAELVHDLLLSHPERLASLCTLLDADVLDGATDIGPSGLDRYGLTFRVRNATGIQETRLPFPAPLECAAALLDAIHQLLWLASRRAG